MSSALAYSPVVLFPEPSTLDIESFQEGPQRYTEHIRRWPSFDSKGRFGSSIASGLPTAAEIRAMTGTSLNLHNPNDVASHNYYPPKFSYADYSYMRGQEVRRDHHHDDNFDHHNASTAELSQVRSADWGRENSHAPKNHSNADYAIASYLQIPASINNSKGSLAEFAAEVGLAFFVLRGVLTCSRSRVCFGLNQPQYCSELKNFRPRMAAP